MWSFSKLSMRPTLEPVCKIIQSSVSWPWNRTCRLKRNFKCEKLKLGSSFRQIATRISEHTKEIHKKIFNFNFSHLKSHFSRHVLFHGHETLDWKILHTGSNVGLIDSLEKLHIIYHNKRSPESIINEQTDFTNYIFSSFLNQSPDFLI